MTSTRRERLRGEVHAWVQPMLGSEEEAEAIKLRAALLAGQAKK